MKEQIQLGQKVKCRVTGLTGIVTGITEYLNGCRRVTIQPPCDKKTPSKLEDPWSIDEVQVDILDKKHILGEKEKEVSKLTGGPMQRAARY